MTERIKTYLSLALTTGLPGICVAAPTFSAGVSQGVINSTAIVEASGLVASRDNPGVLWTHNDSGDTNRIFAIDTSGRLLGEYFLPGALNSDWEDITIGPGPVAGVNYIYVTGPRNNAVVYRVPEPTVYAARQAISPVTRNLAGVESKAFSFPADDGEAMFADPISGDLFLGSKESGTTRFYRAMQAQFASGAPQAADFIGSVPLSKGNGASISPDGSQLTDFDTLMHAARIWGAAAGTAHRLAGGAPRIQPKLTPQLLQQLHDRTTAYLDQLQQDYTAFRDDPRTSDQCAIADQTLHKIVTSQ